MLSATAALALAAASVGSLHSVAPDHWVPFTVLARAQGWSRSRTALITLLCGFGHVTVSVALGLAGLLLGSAALQALGQKLEAVAGILLVGFGVAYAAWGLRKAVLQHLPSHHHHVPKMTAWTLFLLFCADPCVAVIPIVFAAAPLGVIPAVAVVGAYELATLAAMVGLVMISHAGLTRLHGHWFERYGDGAAGGVIAATGLVLMGLGI